MAVARLHDIKRQRDPALKAVVERLSADFNKVLALPEVKEKLAALGTEPVGGTPEAFTGFVRGDIDRWAKIIAAAKIKPE